MAFIQMSVPLVFWGQRPPAHEITCICRTEEKKGVATASRTGQVVLWDILKERGTEKIKLSPRCMLFGSQSAIISMCYIKNWTGDRDRIATLAEDGMVSLWDGKDGACLKYLKTYPSQQTGLKALSRNRYSETLIALYGRHSSIYILDSNSLERLCSLRSVHNPNWVAQICFLTNIEKKDALLAITVNGVAKLWLLPSRSEIKDQEHIYEERSKSLDITNAPVSLVSYSYSNHCIVLAVWTQVWQLFDATGGKMKTLLIHPCEPSVGSWVRGEFIDQRTLITWAKEDGRGFIYTLSPRCVPGLESLEDTIESSTAGCAIKYILGHRSPAPPLSLYLDRYWHIQGDKNGRLYLWDIRKVNNTTPLSPSGTPSQISTLPESSACIADSWEHPAMPCGLTDKLYLHTSSPPTITCALYLTSVGRLVCGQADGSIAVLSATQAATVLMLQPRKFSRGWPQNCIMKGHKGKVNCLLYPHSQSKAYHTDYLLSGSSDFSVKLWDLYSGVLVHTFAVHGGEVKNIVSCPPEINPRLQTCVCSIAEDYSVAILSTSERKCLLVAACHSSPVDCVRWRLKEDFLLVSCTDGKLYVWQIETGSLDRCVDGETAKIILENTTDVATPDQHTISQSVPLQVRSVGVSSSDSLIQVLIFEPQNLINRLSKMEKMSKDVPKKKKEAPKKQGEAFKTYLMARRQFGAGGGGMGRGPPRRTSMPVGSPSQSMVPTSSKSKSKAPTTAAQIDPTAIASSAGTGGLSMREQERAREILGQAVARTRTEHLHEAPGTIIDMVRLLLSCLHAWNLDEGLDQQCEEVLGLVQPCRPVSFGLLSRGSCMSLVLPGWGLRLRQRYVSQTTTNGDGSAREEVDFKRQSTIELPETATPIESSMEKYKQQIVAKPTSLGIKRDDASPSTSPLASRKAVSSVVTFDQKYHVRWNLSRSLTTQHLLTMVSITNTLMNQSVGAHSLAASSGARKKVGSSLLDEDSDSDSEESQTQLDNQIRAMWSQVAALHCVMLPERMEGKFRAPHLPVLASRFLDPCQAIREAAQALLQAELRRIKAPGRRELVKMWAEKLHLPPTIKTSINESAKVKHFVEDFDADAIGPVPTQQQRMTALIILGMIGAEFSEEKQSHHHHHHKGAEKGGGATTHRIDVMDPHIARQTAKTLQGILLEKPHSKAPLHSNLRCSAAELLGRGFQLWEKYVDIPQVVMGLLDLAIQYTPTHPAVGKRASSPSSASSPDPKKGSLSSSKSTKFASDVAKKALNLMVLLRPVTMVTTLAKEVATYLASQHVTHFPHSSLQPVPVGVTPPPSTSGIVSPANNLLPSCKMEILELMKTVIEKCSQQVTLQLLEVVDVVLYCIDQERLKKRSIVDLFPSFSRMPNISYSLKTKRLAVGARSGQVGIYDLKQSRVQMLNAHSHSVTVLVFSEDGKMLATYAYGDSKVIVWQLGTSLFGLNQAPKMMNSWPAISSGSPTSYSHYVRLEWSGSRTIILHMPGGVECKYSL